LKKREQKKLKRKRAAQNKKKKWFDARLNTFVYVQGLPLDVTEDELMDFFKKCGVLKIDKYTGQRKVKIYRDENDKPKGDARICYENIESVEMAIEWLHDTEIRPGYRVSIEQAKFE
jgi:RNA recognition motif-containing protein